MFDEALSASAYILGIAGAFLNVILLVCIKKKSPAELGEMRYFLANMAISDILIAVSGPLSLLKISYNGIYTFVKFNGPIRNLGLSAAKICICLWSARHRSLEMSEHFLGDDSGICFPRRSPAFFHCLGSKGTLCASLRNADFPELLEPEPETLHRHHLRGSFLKI